ncbi:MAG: hypothetical protein IMZ44_19400 [Planctomycetes bacterium]|nr:hypothetical protein [Planctomycetota bacterium]
MNPLIEACDLRTRARPGGPQAAPPAAERRRDRRAPQPPDIRHDKVRQMRRLIALGRLETPERIEGTLRRLLEELGR